MESKQRPEKPEEKRLGLYVSLKEHETIEELLTELVKSAVKKVSGKEITDEEARKYLVLPQPGNQGKWLIKPFRFTVGDSEFYCPLLVLQDSLSTIFIAPKNGFPSGVYHGAINDVLNGHVGLSQGAIVPNVALNSDSSTPIGYYPECRH